MTGPHSLPPLTQPDVDEDTTFRLPVWSWLALWMGFWVGAPVALHYALHEFGDAVAIQRVPEEGPELVDPARHTGILVQGNQGVDGVQRVFGDGLRGN